MEEKLKMTEQEYMELRLDSQMQYFSKASRKAKEKNERLQTIAIILGVIVPVVVNLDAEWFALAGIDTLKVIITVLSTALAIITGVINFKKYGDLWLTYRITLETLKREKHFYLTASQKYRHSKNAFPLFVENVEKILSAENEQFQATITNNAENMET